MNYTQTFISIADDCKANNGVVPSVKSGKTKTIPVLQFEMLCKPYVYTQEDVLFQVHAQRKAINPKDQDARAKFFEKPQPCLRTSGLGKRYGWGIHFDENGKAALYACDSDEYKQFQQNNSLQQLKAMRSKRE
ncbi:MAG: DUF6157 family protein [Gammaproteobacteria bacterium]|nr:DUF6157 family protein [Gammaproteobacteria bacterium]